MLEFTLSGFIYAIVNFLLLVGLLYRFFHRPLLEILEKRRDEIRSIREEAETKNAEAEELRAKYEDALAAIDDKWSEILSKAKEKTQQQRDQILSEARESAKREIEDARRGWQRERLDALSDLRETIERTAVAMAGHVLEQLAEKKVDHALWAMALDEIGELEDLPDREQDTLVARGNPVRVVSAVETGATMRDKILGAIKDVAGKDAEVVFEVREGLVAGVRVEFVSRAIDATVSGMLDSLFDELEDRRSGSDAAGGESPVDSRPSSGQGGGAVNSASESGEGEAQ